MERIKVRQGEARNSVFRWFIMEDQGKAVHDWMGKGQNVGHGKTRVSWH